MSHLNLFQNKTILIGAGGTGGHVYPALSVAKALHNQGATIVWIGSEHGIENKLVLDEYNLYPLTIKGVRGNGVKRLIKAPIMIIKAISKAKSIFKQQKPDLYIGFGGFVAGPAGIAAKLTKTPLLLHEQNAAMGLTNRILRHLTPHVLLAFPITHYHYHVVGNPIRPSICEIKPTNSLTDRMISLLIIGGSQGARIINQTLPDAIKLCHKTFKITHQTGHFDHQTVEMNYQTNHIKATVIPYIEDMTKAYQEADLIIARAGALTVSEISSAGRACIFIPMASAVDNHQYKNASFLADNKAAIIIEEKELNASNLANILNQLDNTSIINMALKSKQQTHEKALSHILNKAADILND